MKLYWQASEDETAYMAETEHCTYTVKFDGSMNHDPWYIVLIQKEKAKETPDIALSELLNTRKPSMSLPSEYPTAKEAQHACERHAAKSSFL